MISDPFQSKQYLKRTRELRKGDLYYGMWQRASRTGPINTQDALRAPGSPVSDSGVCSVLHKLSDKI